MSQGVNDFALGRGGEPRCVLTCRALLLAGSRESQYDEHSTRAGASIVFSDFNDRAAVLRAPETPDVPAPSPEA